MEPFSRTYISVSQPGLDVNTLSDRHRPIFEALRRRDAGAAAAAMENHLMEAAELLRPTVEHDKEPT
jgi:DNA-binding GntR family transcriptional regulator